ncbi:nicotinate (nicotinamide) nucleotide adenylyltransferase [Desertifilum sp. FACHB-1129]|uniref:Nicotinate (Nicotinamide) nucleotide adenylyltransferase n=2 Tax=Desertifilum tharense IPPAS B-1220 TaxID=1781255 RepID=A0ACD5GV12_9CYAN|nr:MULTISPECIES: nicotinate (nicotinamide) nucleotide adenylyltransferase [Desertifilum]MDA0213258.1 nicotinate (nicotinamide) nucleotide adenylyltransferase [Cyanobacteria bacterium FC1]MBD2314754.1 nicotinate (nicotinamide) nucleotide adenylyltransferase [Desertifilum sp. FACHB-1129]MBD2323923.1 nicotinate (nicotinamide) nucleotide adenylyltransferase [Desertifilum sp. FACHB-866]MBD2333768.1 nicotinate (nicotinamide) nucleotide adenylyltransferase [Desertifilum sp. FACHB-868]OEJ73790.1 nicot
MRSLAIWGGSFDPVHWGHVQVAEAAIAQVELEAAIWVPARCLFHKSRKGVASFADRLHMVGLAIAHRPQFWLVPQTPDLTRSDYAIDTLQALQIYYPHRQWYWIAGLDTFRSLPRWYRRRELVAQCQWLIAPRSLDSGCTIQEVCQQVERQLAQEAIVLRWQILQMPEIEISSSQIRHAQKWGQSISDRVPEAVARYIKENQLYRDPPRN